MLSRAEPAFSPGCRTGNPGCPTSKSGNWQKNGLVEPPAGHATGWINHKITRAFFAVFIKESGTHGVDRASARGQTYIPTLQDARRTP